MKDGLAIRTRKRGSSWKYLLTAGIASATAVGGAFIATSMSGASGKSLNAAEQAAQVACGNYLTTSTSNETPTATPATLARAYPTTASSLESWLLGFDPAAHPSAVDSLAATTSVTACVLQGNWTLPAGGGAGTNSVGYEVVVITPDGSGTPILWGPSAIVNAAAPTS